jgi:transposase
MTKRDDAVARLRAELIVEVHSGRMSAQEAAKRLGVSRKTYYKWEKRALRGMVEALGNRASGRPAPRIDPEKEALRKKSAQLEKRLKGLEQTLKVRELLKPSVLDRDRGRTEKKG